MSERIKIVRTVKTTRVVRVEKTVKTIRRKAYPNGYAIWEGKLPDGEPGIVLAVGFVNPSDNPKTGPMIQVSLMRADVPPHVAIKTGLDRSVCNDCELRQYTVGQLAKAAKMKPGAKPPMCYVTTNQGPRASWDAWQRGLYPTVARRGLPKLFGGRRVRIGTYGNFSNVPLWLVETIASSSDAWTLYDHNWRPKHAQPFKQFAMASVSSVQAKEEANALGWRTFRVKMPWESVMKDEVVCPASEEAGYRTDCYHCRLCCGTARRAKNVVINDHGPTSQGLQRKRDEGRLVQLGTERLRRG